MKPSAYSVGEAVALSAAVRSPVPTARSIRFFTQEGNHFMSPRGVRSCRGRMYLLPRGGDLDYISRSIYIIQDMK